MKVAILGGTGFVGSYIVDELINNGYSPKLLVRKGSELKNFSNCEIVYGNIEDEKSILKVIKDTKAIIYNIGIIREFPDKGITFQKLHFEGVQKCIEIAEKINIDRFILMSANGVKSDGTSYQKTKFHAEKLLENSSLKWTIFRPSLIFGKPYSSEHKEFCTQLRDDMLSLPLPAPLFYKGILPIDAGSFSMSPIHAKNVAEFFVKSIKMNDTINKIYNLGGVNNFTWKEIIKNIALASRKSTFSIPAPVVFIKILAKIFDRFKWFPVTEGQLEMLMEGNIVKEQYFSNFNIDPIEFSAENISYLEK